MTNKLLMNNKIDKKIETDKQHNLEMIVFTMNKLRFPYALV